MLNKWTQIVGCNQVIVKKAGLSCRILHYNLITANEVRSEFGTTFVELGLIFCILTRKDWQKMPKRSCEFWSLFLINGIILKLDFPLIGLQV